MGNPWRIDLRTRLMMVVGGITALLMMVISVGILFVWRTLLIEDQRNNAAAVASAASITIIDAFLRLNDETPEVEDLLERHIDNFMRTLDGVSFIAVVDINSRIIAHSDIVKYNQILKDSLSLLISGSVRPATMMYRSPEHGWTLEAVHPLQIAGKRWGVLRIGFDANPLRGQIRLMFFLLVGFTAIITAVTLGILYIMIGRITQSLRSLVTLMDETNLGSATSIPLPPQEGEVGILLRHFDMLRQRLAQSKTELISVQQQIYQAEKLASIGRLASGVAHEINNPLNGIKSALYAIQKEPDNREQTQSYFRLIDEGVNYIQVVVQKLLGFARQQPASMDAVLVNDLIHNVIWLLDYKLKQKSIDVRLELDPSLPVVRADAPLISEVIMNLVLNGCDAVDNGGMIEVRTEAKSDDAVTIIVRDNGVGIPEENMKKIFDPFFTTKGPKEGTGLGLSVSLGIVETHGGTIRVHSTPGAGTEFTVTFPLTKHYEHTTG